MYALAPLGLRLFCVAGVGQCALPRGWMYALASLWRPWVSASFAWQAWDNESDDEVVPIEAYSPFSSHISYCLLIAYCSPCQIQKSFILLVLVLLEEALF